MDRNWLLSKITKGIRHPRLIIFYLMEQLRSYLLEQRKRKVSLIEKNGEIFYRYKGVLYPDYLNKGNASSFILSKAMIYCNGKGIDIGAGAWPLPGAIPVLNEEHQNAYKLDNFLDESLDYIFSSHCLEHLERWKIALKLWIRKIKPGGILFLYLPHKSMRLWNPGGPWAGYIHHKWIPELKIIKKFLENNGMKIIKYDPDKDKYWSFYIIAKKNI